MTDNELEAILKQIEENAKKKVENSVSDSEPQIEVEAPVTKETVVEEIAEEAVEVKDTVVFDEIQDTIEEKEEIKLVLEEDAQDETVDYEELKDDPVLRELGVFGDTGEQKTAVFVPFGDSSFDNNEEYDELEDNDDKAKNKKPLIIAIAVVLVIAVAIGVYFGFFHNKKEETPTTTKSTTQQEITVNPDLGPVNPLTGETGYNEAAIDKRPVAVVVENEYSTESVRPQWGMNKADIVLEGESEFSTRLLLFFADYTNMPEQIGPARSARPPFINFSQIFDSVFIHAGLSHSKGNYVGADTVFESKNVDHINLLATSEDGKYFGRDRSRGGAVEHTGFLNGKNVPQLLENKKIRTELNKSRFSVLQFNETAEDLMGTPADKIKFRWSTRACPKKGIYTYDADKKIYTTSDFDSRYGDANLEFANLVFLLDQTEYVVKENYKGSGNSETYCNYKLSGGKGAVASMGTMIEITWGVKDGKLWMKDSSGKEVKLNPGKTYIGYGSSNNGGSFEVVTDTTEQ